MNGTRRATAIWAAVKTKITILSCFHPNWSFPKKKKYGSAFFPLKSLPERMLCVSKALPVAHWC